MTIGQKIKNVRKERKLTLKDLSNRTGLCLMTLSNIERDKYKPNTMSLAKIAIALESDYDELWNLWGN